MSAGTFGKTFYQASYGGGTNIHPIKVQPETIAASTGDADNDPPTGPITNPISAQASGGRRSIGLHARIIYLQLLGTPPAEYSAGSRTKIPCLTEAFYNAAIAPGATISYLGTTWKVIGSSEEKVR